MALDWTCHICWQSWDDVTHMTPCLHQLCCGCAFWWAKKRLSCAVCGHRIKTIQYSMWSDDDYVQCCILQHTQVMACRVSRGPAELVLITPEHCFPPKLWAAFFQEHPEDLKPLLLWLQEIERICSNEWWEVLGGQCTVMGFLCTYGLNQVAKLQGLARLRLRWTWR